MVTRLWRKCIPNCGTMFFLPKTTRLTLSETMPTFNRLFITDHSHIKRGLKPQVYACQYINVCDSELVHCPIPERAIERATHTTVHDSVSNAIIWAQYSAEYRKELRTALSLWGECLVLGCLFVVVGEGLVQVLLGCFVVMVKEGLVLVLLGWLLVVVEEGLGRSG